LSPSANAHPLSPSVTSIYSGACAFTLRNSIQLPRGFGFKVQECDGNHTTNTLHPLPPPYILLPTPYSLHPTPYTLHPTSYILHPTSYTLHPTPYTLHPTPYTLYPSFYTLHPTPYTPHPTPYTLNTLHPQHPTLNTLHPTPYTLHPQHPTPYTLHPTHPPCTELNSIYARSFPLQRGGGGCPRPRHDQHYSQRLQHARCLAQHEVPPASAPHLEGLGIRI